MLHMLTEFEMFRQSYYRTATGPSGDLMQSGPGWPPSDGDAINNPNIDHELWQSGSDNWVNEGASEW